MNDERWYDRWTWGVSVAVLAFGGVLPIAGYTTPGESAGVVAVTGLVALSLLIAHGIGPAPRRGHTLPNVLTATRGVAAVVLLVAVSGIIPPPLAVPTPVVTDRWSMIVFLLLSVVEVSDFFDGRVARARGSSRFGGIWDMENDAFFTFALSFAAWAVHDFPLPVLLIGWMRYLYFVIARFQGDPPMHPRSFKLFAKTVAATLVIVLIGSFLVVLPRWFRVTAMWIALVLQIVSFGWDALLHIRSRRAGTSSGGS